MSKKLTIYTDGASRGNPGPAAIGVVLLDCEGNTVREISETIGDATNNVAEYHALIAALKAAQEAGTTEVVVRSDSELLVQQMNGGYRIKSQDLLPLAMDARSLLNSFASATVCHVPRDENKRADQLASAALKGKPAKAEKPVHSSNRREGAGRRFISAHSVDFLTQRQLTDLAKKIRKDDRVTVLRMAIDTEEGQMVCESAAASREEVLNFFDEHGHPCDWLMRVDVEQGLTSKAGLHETADYPPSDARRPPGNVRSPLANAR